MSVEQIKTEIKDYEEQVKKTTSNQRKWQLIKHINKLKKELKTYRFLRENKL